METLTCAISYFRLFQHKLTVLDLSKTHFSNSGSFIVKRFGATKDIHVDPRPAKNECERSFQCNGFT